MGERPRRHDVWEEKLTPGTIAAGPPIRQSRLVPRPRHDFPRTRRFSHAPGSHPVHWHGCPPRHDGRGRRRQRPRHLGRLPRHPPLGSRALHPPDAIQDRTAELRLRSRPLWHWRSRDLMKQGDDCWVVAPALLPQTPGARVTTDRRDAGP
jgi:hypothetical protein